MRTLAVALAICACSRREEPRPDPAPRVAQSAETQKNAPLRKKDQPVNGAVWSTTPPETIPSAPVAGVLFGVPFVPDRVELHDRVKMAIPTSKSPMLVLRKGGPACGDMTTFEGCQLGVEPFWETGKVPKGPIAATNRGGCNLQTDAGNLMAIEPALSIVIDTFDAATHTATGRVYAAFDDPHASMVVGAFTATYCP